MRGMTLLEMHLSQLYSDAHIMDKSSR